jgi:uncharacterized protein YcnI
MKGALRHRFSRRTCKVAAVLSTASGALLLLTGPASAHVRVLSDDAQESSPATLRFRVPSEKVEVTTVRVDVTLPQGVTATAVLPAPGWTRGDVTSHGGRPAHIVWTATAGHEIKPDTHRYFGVRVGPLPDRTSLAFDVAQTYSDGSIVNWDERQTGDEEPALPAPVLVLDATGAGAEQNQRPRAAQPAATGTDAPARAVAAPASGSQASPWLAWTVAGAVVVGAGVVVVRRRSAPR